MKNDPSIKSFKNANLLDMIPVSIVDHRFNDKGKVDLLIPKFKNEKFARWFIPRNHSLYYFLHLDEQGTQVWVNIDGKTNIRDICKRLTDFHDDEITERVGKFITQLFEAKCITFR